jgi:hypothetical protein
VGAGVVGVADGETVPEDLIGLVGVADEEAVDALDVGFDVGLVVGLALALGVGVGVPVVGVAVGAVGVGDALGTWSGSQDWPVAVVAAPVVALVVAALAATAKLTPEAAVSRTLPAISVTVAGRACAKRMKRPTSPARYCCGTTRSVRSMA